MRAVILAGGKGTRLAPYTTVLPKPLMPIGDMPILEVVLKQLKATGVGRATIAVGHLAEIIQAFFGNGARMGIEIDYSMEDAPLGTVGPLKLIPGLTDTFLLMNGDVLTTLDYRELIRHHRESGADVTIASHLRDVKIDFGVIETNDGGFLIDYVEKPSLVYRVSMGVYVFEPSALNYVAPGERCDFPELIKKLLADGRKVSSYPFSGYWLDIGRPDDYALAVEEFEKRRNEFLPSEGI